MLSNLWAAITFVAAMYISAASEYVEGNKKECYIWLACWVIMTFLALQPLILDAPPIPVMIATFIVGIIIGGYRLKSFQFNNTRINQESSARLKNSGEGSNLATKNHFIKAKMNQDTSLNPKNSQKELLPPQNKDSNYYNEGLIVGVLDEPPGWGSVVTFFEFNSFDGVLIFL